MVPSFFLEDTSMPNKPRIRTAFHLFATVRLVAGMCCPHCGTELRAEDVDPLEHGDVRAICAACHCALFTIESR
jgi:hypothetical protein